MVSRGDIGTRRSRAPARDRPWRSAAFAFLAVLLVHVPPASDAYELACQPEGSVTTVAGDGTPGFRDGLQERSAFRAPSGVVVRAATGDVYVADSGNHRIRKVTPSNVVTTVVGSGIAGWVDGAATRARLSDPRGLAWSADGLLFVADAGNNRIRVVDLDIGGVATFAGSGEDGYLDHDDPMVAQINKPTGLAYHDASRVLYVADGDGRVRGVRAYGDPNGAGVFTVLNRAGKKGFLDHTDGSLAVFNTPSLMAFDHDQRTLYIADRHNNRIRAMDVATRAVTTAAGAGAPPARGSSLAADGARGGPVLPGGEDGMRFDEPVGVAFFLEPRDVGGGDGDAGAAGPGRRTLLVTEAATNRVRRVALEGNVTGSEGVASAVSFPYAGSYVAASGHRDELGQASLFAAPAGVAVVPPAGGGAANGAAAYVCDSGNHALRRLERRLPTRVRVSVSATDASIFDASRTSEPGSSIPSAMTHARRDAVMDEYGYYSVNGPPNNETTHLSDTLTYRGETHDATMCLYPGQEYFFHFKGALRAVVADESLFVAKNVTARNAYVAWEGFSVDDERSENVKLRGGGCTDPRAPNFDAWADREDGSCVPGVSVRITVASLGDFGVYQIEGPGVYYTEEVAPRVSENVEDDVHELVFAAYPQAAYTVQLHGALSAVVADAPGQVTNFTYLNHTSRNANSHRIEMFRPAGAGCTKSAFINYSPFATSDDGTCVLGSFLRVDSAATRVDSSNANVTADDWYEWGVVNALQPLLLGGQAVLTPVLFTAANVTAQQTVYVSPGRFPVRVFGDARATFTKVSEAGSEVLLSVDGTDASLRVDEHGFNSTLGNALAYLTVLGKDDELLDEGANSDSMVMGVDADAAVSGLVVANLSASAAAAARNDLVSDGARGAWDFLALVWQANPLRLKLDYLAKVTFPYDVAKLPTRKGNEETVAVRASDLTASDWRVIPGAVFDAAAEKVTVRVDYFSLFSVAARASARDARPARVRHTGGAPVTLDGVDFRVPPVANATGGVFCKFGELFTKAEWTPSGDPRGFGDAVVCATPAVSRAGFVSVEFYDAGTFLSSLSDLRVLFTAPPFVFAVAPLYGPDAGAAVVALAGANFFTLPFDEMSSAEISCHFGDFGDFGNAAPGVAVSSVLALCETPARDKSLHPEVRVGVASDGVHDARTAKYAYRVSVSDAVGFFDEEEDDETKRRAPGDHSSTAYGSASGGAVVDARLGTTTGALARSAQCAFGATWVSARSGEGETNLPGLHCLAPAGVGETSVSLVASLAEPSAFLGTFRWVDDFGDSVSFPFHGERSGENAVRSSPISRERSRVTDDEHVASLFDVGDGSFGARLDATRLVDIATFDATRLVCVAGGVAVKTELTTVWVPVPNERRSALREGDSLFSEKTTRSSTGLPRESRRESLSCWPIGVASQTSGFVAVAVALRGAGDVSAAPVASLLVPSSPPRFLGVVGGAYVPAAVGAHVWLAGAHLLPHGGGGTWPGTGSGFGWGDGGDATCVAARRETRETGEKKTALVSRRTSSARARFVSSALVACEVPDVFEELEELEELFFGGEADVRLRAAVGEGGAESSRSEESNDSFYRERDKDEADAFVVARALRGVSVSSAEGLEFLPAEGGALVRVAWRGVGSLGDAPRDPNWFACAFGSIAPVAFRAGPGPGPGPGTENAGVCASPATRARRAEPQLAGESKFRNFDFGVAYPGFGRARFDAQTPTVSVVATATTADGAWTPLVSAVPRVGGTFVRVAGYSPRSFLSADAEVSNGRTVACAFDGIARAAATTTTTTRAGSVPGLISCASPFVARGAFVTLRIGNPGFGDEIAGDVGFAGHGHVLLAYAVPRVTSATPRSVREAGGSVVFIAGVDFPGGAAFDAGAAAARCAFAAGTRGDGDDALSLFAAEAAFVSSTLTRCETPALVFSSRDGRSTEEAFSFSLAVARGADVASARAYPSGAAIAAHVAPRVASARPSAAPADDGGALVTVAVTVTNDSNDDSFSFSSSTRGPFKRQFVAKTTDYCVFGAVSVRANPIAIVSDDEDESDAFSALECLTPTRARGAAPVAVAREWDVTFDDAVQVVFQ